MGQHPKGLYLLFITEMAERFSYYGMRALLVLYLTAALFTSEMASQIYGTFTGLIFITPIIGGFVADRYWGHVRSIIAGGLTIAAGQFCMFLSALFAQQAIFEPNGAIDPSVNNTLSIFLLICALTLLILGNGFFKPNISTMIGDLYPEGDLRVDAGFTIFYMGVNVGSFIAPLICGTVGTGSWDNLAPFKWGFLCACLAMLASLAVFVLLKKKYLRTPDGRPVGLPPTREERETLKHEDDETLAEHRRVAQERSNPAVRIGFVIVLGIALLALFLSRASNITDIIDAVIFDVSIIIPLCILIDTSLTNAERKHIFALLLFIVFAVFFFAAFEQAGSSLTLFADKYVDRSIFGFTVPTAWFQSVNPIAIVILAPIFASITTSLAKKQKNLSVPFKCALSLAILASGYLMISLATKGIGEDPSFKVAMIWLVLLYVIESVSELLISPVGLSLVNKLSPKKFATVLMGVWFTASAIGNVLAGNISALLPLANSDGTISANTFGMISIGSVSEFYLYIAIMVGVVSLLAFLLIRIMKKLMNATED